ncbi:MAG: M20 family metallo-hydrolase [Chthoniobacterales bacterium]
MIQIDRLCAEIDTLAGFSSHPAPAVTRVLFSEEDRAARSWLKEVFAGAGLQVREDAVGNVFARWEGSDPTLVPFATGSHIDAIPNAGKFDGVIGVLGAVEAVRALQARGFNPRRSLDIIMFTAEEPTRFGLGCLGSRLMGGALEPAAADGLKDSDGTTLGEFRSLAGFVGTLESVCLGEGAYSGFLELHIEQGPLLERDEVSIGAVEKIAAPAAFRVKMVGEGGHAGAVLMPDRHDAGLAGAELALAVEAAVLATRSPDTVGTTGVFSIEPGAINSVPCRATLEIDLRDTDIDARNDAERHIRQATAEIAERRGVRIDWETINSDPPAICASDLVEAIEAAAAARGFSHRRMISRAYHDSLFMARVCPTAMLFVPCRNGWSHRPDEYVVPADLERGVLVLADVIERQLGA